MLASILVDGTEDDAQEQQQQCDVSDCQPDHVVPAVYLQCTGAQRSAKDSSQPLAKRTRAELLESPAGEAE